MTFRTLIQRSLRYHWRLHLGVVIGAVIGSAALIGALVVGDSVKGSLRQKALERLGRVTFALSSGDRLFRSSLAGELRASVRDHDSLPVSIAPALEFRGSVSTGDGSARENDVSVLGVDFNSWSTLASSAAQIPSLQTGEVLLNKALGLQLSATVGDVLLVRLPKPSALSQEAVLTPRDDAAVTLRVRCAGILEDDQLANFSLQAGQGGAMNVFIGLLDLQDAIDRKGTANTLLVATPPSESSENEVAALDAALAKQWRLTDAECEIIGSTPNQLQLRSPRVFLDVPIEEAALAARTNAKPILTYIANLITLDANATPYSMVTAAGAPWTPLDLGDDEIVLNQWLADDLQAKPGDEIKLVYYDPESGANLAERTNAFRVHSIVPMDLPWVDRTLMPEFPGIDKAESTADWDTAFPLKYKIRPKDDEYWREYRGTPKAFITLAAGKKMWANRFGEVTAIRFPAPTNSAAATPPAVHQADEKGNVVERIPARPSTSKETLESKILSSLDPSQLGLRFEPVREQALKSAEGAQDFGGLFIGFSMFLIAAALILMALLFQFGLEQRASEVGTLLALGFTHKQVRRLLLGEGAALSFIGGIIGLAGGVLYAKAMLLGLRTVWSDAVGGTTLDFFVTPTSLFIGLFASTLVAVFTIWFALRKQARRPAIELLNSQLGEAGLPVTQVRGRPHQSAENGTRRVIHILTNSAAVGIGSLVISLVLVGWALATGETANAGAFFGAGTLALIGGLAIVSWRLRRETNALPPGLRRQVTIKSLAFRGAARRRSRSVATAALLASGSFLILSIGVFRLDANRDATERSSGTGGFALIGESTIPVVQDLNTPSGREFFALGEKDVEGVDFVQFRVRAGDEASCLNLNRAQKPQLLGVVPEAMEGRFTFAKVAKELEPGEGWKLLNSRIEDQDSEIDAVPAIGDLNSILWAMHKKVGDTIDYTDGRGRPFKVRIVGAVANSILQGNLIIDEAEFVKRFPNESGYQYFLMDAPSNRLAEVSATLSRSLQDYGLEVTPTAQRLNQFNAVQNTYLGTFQIIGGLGLLLGSAGLGIVVLRNVLERRGELAVLMALGYRKRLVEQLVLLEHAGLLGLGLAIGLAAAGVAVLPTLLSQGSQLPYATLLPTLLAVLTNGLAWTWIATRVALRGNTLEALRNE